MPVKGRSGRSSEKDKKSLKKFLIKFSNVTKHPHEFLSAQPEKENEIKSILKDLYSWLVQKNENNKRPEVLPELVLDDMEEEQIWQQIEIYNECACPSFIQETSKLLSAKDDKFFVDLEANLDFDEEEDGEIQSGKEPEDDVPEEDYFSQDPEESDFEDEDADKAEDKQTKLKKKHRKTVVDDKFFKLGEMEEFLNLEDEKERQKDKKKDTIDLNAVDYFNEHLGDEEEENVNYKDFFEEMDNEDSGIVNKQGNYPDDYASAEDNFLQEENASKSAEEEDVPEAENDDEFPDEEEENEAFDQNKRPAIEQYSESDDDSEANAGDEDKVKSSFEVRQQRLKQRIEEFEDEALAEKPWQLKGEIKSTGRPQNSLLQEVLEFDSTTRPAPVITEETTMRLEDIIRQRIKNKAWDDVEKKVKTITTPQEYRKKLILNQEKSKESLAQIYEKDYQKELDKLDPNKEENEEEPKRHKEIKAMMRNLFIKLDALSNFHYTPKPVAPEARIITNTPAVNMEEVAPVAMSDAKMLAPEEIKQRVKGAVLGKSERTKADKNRERRKKKSKQKAIYKAKEARDFEKEKLGIKLSTKEEKGKVLRNVMKSKNVKTMTKSNEGSSFKSSKAFFTQLQDKTTIKRTKQPKRPDAGELSAKKLKL